MKKLLAIDFKIWFFIIIILSASFIALFLILNMKIEKTISTPLQISDKGVATLIVKNKIAYLIKKDEKISLLVNDKFLDSTIKNIKYDDEKEEYLMTLNNLNKELLPNTTVNAKIIYDEHTILDALLNPSV